MRYSIVTGTRLGLAACLSVLVSGSAMAGDWGGPQLRGVPAKPDVMEPLIFIDRGRLPMVEGRYSRWYETLVADTAPDVVEPDDAWQAP